MSKLKTAPNKVHPHSTRSPQGRGIQYRGRLVWGTLVAVLLFLMLGCAPCCFWQDWGNNDTTTGSVRGHSARLFDAIQLVSIRGAESVAACAAYAHRTFVSPPRAAIRGVRAGAGRVGGRQGARLSRRPGRRRAVVIIAAVAGTKIIIYMIVIVICSPQSYCDT